MNELDRKIAREYAAQNDGYQMNGGNFMAIYFYTCFAIVLISIVACTFLTYCFPYVKKDSKSAESSSKSDTKSEESEKI